MQTKRSSLLVIVAGVTLGIPVSATADIARRGSVSIGGNVGGHDHPDDGGTKLGLGLDAEFRLGMFTVGGDVARDSYAPLDGVPVHATSMAGRAGIAVPFARFQTNRRIEIAAIGSFEFGNHRYSPNGTRKEFLFDGRTTYRGNSGSSRFTGVRAGAALTLLPEKSSAGVIVKLEIVGRRDLQTVDLEYDRLNCGGLFRDDNDCSTERDMTQAGGTELVTMTSVGLLFGK